MRKTETEKDNNKKTKQNKNTVKEYIDSYACIKSCHTRRELEKST